MTDVTICNRALGWVGGNRITNLDTTIDGSVEAQLCSDNYAGARDVVLEEGGWNFATKRYILTPLTVKPAWGDGNQFLVPTKVIRVLRVSDTPVNAGSGKGIPWRIEANEDDSKVIISNSELLYIKTIIRIIDTTKFTPGMEQALSARLAMDLAIPIKRSRTLQETMANLYQQKLLIAMSTENMQGTSEKLTNDSLTLARFSNSTILGPFV